MCLAIPGRVFWIDEDPPPGSIPARLQSGTTTRDVDLIMLPEAEVGDYVFVHAGYAIRVIPREQARETLRLLDSADLRR